MTTPRKVLIVEDEWLIAEEIVQAVEKAGYSVVGPASSSAKALKLIAEERVDAALLDINLLEGHSYSVGAALKAKNVPYAFLTGFNEEDIRPEFSDIVCLTKPVPPEDIAPMLARMLSKS